MDYAQIEAKLESMNIDPEELERIEEGDSETSKEEFEKIFGEIKIVEHYGGEGQGDDYYSTYHFVKHNVFVKIDAYWISHDGVQWDNASFKKVTPKIETKTVYE